MLWYTLLGTGLAVILLSLSFAPFEHAYLAWVSLVPLLLLIKRLSLLRAALGALTVGFFFYVAHGYWMLRIDGFHGGNFSLGMFWNGLFFGLFGFCARYFHTKVSGWNTVTFPTIWVLLEYVKTHIGFLSFSWGILGYSQYTLLPVAQVSAWTGVYGVSFLIVLVNMLVAEVLPVLLIVLRRQDGAVVLCRCRQACSWQLCIFIVLCIAMAFSHQLSALGEDDASARLRVALVQAPLYAEKTATTRSREAVFRNFSRLSLGAAALQPQLIAWPDSSVPARFPYERLYVEYLSRLAQETKAYLLVGSHGLDKQSARGGKERFANSVFLLSPQGKITGRYDKIRLLPFNEYLPLRGYIKWPAWIVSAGPDTLPGKQLTVFQTDTARFGVQICWENLFPDLFRQVAAQGVDFMVSMTNESFIDAPAAHYQMLAMNVFRAIENRVAIVRTAPTGISAIIAPSGRIIARVQDTNAHDIDVEGYVVGEIPLVSFRSFYTRYGDWFVLLLAIIFIGFLVAAMYHHRKPEAAQPEAHLALEH